MIECHTDATWAPADRRGAWAAAVVGQGRRELQAQEIREAMEDHNSAELIAARNALQIAVHSWAERHIRLVTDSMFVVSAIRSGNVPATRDIDRRILAEILRLIETHDLDVQTKHVRGHTTQTSRKARINRWCDAAARAALAEARL